MADYAPPIADPESLLTLLSSLGSANAPPAAAPPLSVAAPPPPASVMPPPMPSPVQAPGPLPMPPVNHGVDWKQLIDFVGPIAGMIASGNQAHRTGFATGWTQAHQQAEAVRNEKAQQDLKMREAGANYLLKIADQAQTIQDPAEYQQFIDLADTAGSRAGYTQPGELKTKLQFPASRLNANKLNEIKGELDSYEKNGYNLDELANSNAHLTLKDGTTIPFATALDMTRKRPVSESGAPISAPNRQSLQDKTVTVNGVETLAGWDPKTNKYYDQNGQVIPNAQPKKSDKPPATLDERAAALLSDIERAKSTGDTATATAKQAEYDRIIRAKKDLNAAGRNPDLDAINLSLKELQLESARNKAKESGALADIKPGTKEYRLAEDLASGDLPFQDFNKMLTARGAGGQNVNNMRMAFYDKAREINPNFTPAMYEIGYKFASNAKVQQQVASIKNVLAGVPDLLKASDAASRSGVTLLNKFIVPGGIALGGKKYTDFKTAQIAFADELSGALGYGSATDMSREMGFNMTDPNLSPENFRSAIENIIVPFVHRKKASLTGQMGPYGSTVGPNSGSSGPKEIRYDANGNVIK